MTHSNIMYLIKTLHFVQKFWFFL